MTSRRFFGQAEDALTDDVALDLARATPDRLAAAEEERADHRAHRVAGAARFKILDEITDIDLADPVLMEKAGFELSSDNPAAFRDFSAEGIRQRHDIGYKIAQMKLQELFENHGLLPASR